VEEQHWRSLFEDVYMILISPYSKLLRNGKKNPKNYPFWEELIILIKKEFPEHTLVQIGVEGEEKLDCHSFLKGLPFKELAYWLDQSTTWIAVDSFFPHFASYVGKKGIAIFGQSDPNVFGCPNNINLLKDRKYLRENMYDFWENAAYRPESFVKPEKVIDALRKITETLNKGARNG